MVVMSARLIEMLLTMVVFVAPVVFVAVIVRVLLVTVGMAVFMIMVAFVIVMIMVAFISMRMVMGAEAYRPVSIDQVEGSQQCHPDAR